MPSDLGNSRDLVTIDHITKNTVVMKNGSLRQILMVSGVNVALKSEQEQNLLTLAYQNFLNSVDFQIQIVVHSRKVNIEKYLTTLEAQRLKEPSALLQNQNMEYQTFIKSFIQENAVMEKSFYVIIPFSSIAAPTASSVSKLNIFHKQSVGEKAQSAAEVQARFTEDLAQLNQRTTQVAEGLRAMELQAQPLTDEQLVELFYNLYNPESVEKEDIQLPGGHT